MHPRLSGTFAVLALALAAVPLTATSSHAVTCTIKGTSGPDKLYGTNGADVICGVGGNDRIYARGGNDVVLAGPGDDMVFGDGGNDRLEGGTGDDGLWGRSGDDTLLGQDGDDELVDEGGADVVRGGDGHDVVGAGEGTDLYDGGAGRDQVRYLDRRAVKVSLDGVANDGVPGENDQVIGFEDLDGTSYRDVLVGNGGVNRITGGDGNDVIRGVGGADNLSGGQGEDRIEGGDGNDRIYGGASPDLILGGAGADTVDGQTAEYFHNVCEADAADTVTRCLVDRKAPTGSVSVSTPSSFDLIAPGDDLGVSVSTLDAGGTASVGVRVVRYPDQAVLAWCPATLAPSMAEATRSDNYWTASCHVPADAPTEGVTVQLLAVDRLGNTTAYGVPALSRELAVHPAGDTTGPVIGDATGLPQSVASPGDEFTVSVPVTDPDGVTADGVGLTWSGPATVTCTGPTRTGHLVEASWSWACTVPSSSGDASYGAEMWTEDQPGNTTSRFVGGFSAHG